MGREGRDYWEAQLSEYWDSGLTIQEYSELKELPYESTRRWIRVLQKARQDDVSDPESLELVEIKPLQTNASDSSGIRLLIDGIEIAVAKGFDGTTLSEVLNLLKARSCSASAARSWPRFIWQTARERQRELLRHSPLLQPQRPNFSSLPSRSFSRSIPCAFSAAPTR